MITAKFFKIFCQIILLNISIFINTAIPNELLKQKNGSLEIICGPTCAGKTTELIRRIKLAQNAQESTICFKYNLNKNIPSKENISSRNGSNLTVFETNDTTFIIQLSSSASVVGIDEAQFSPPKLVSAIEILINNGKRVIASGLDLNCRLIPFGHMSLLMAMADNVTKLHATCVRCGKKAGLGQRMINKQPANFDIPDPIGKLLSTETYEPRCRDCFEIDHRINLTAIAKEYEKIQHKAR